MALQTFTAGQVLTAAQVNALQANDYNQTVSTKTANYVLVAADKGTRVEMNAAGATTITVNTDLFNAGDTLFIQNIGAGVCTITAGTATVSTAGSLALAQFQGGTLYFVSAGVAIFYPTSAGGGLTQVANVSVSAAAAVEVSNVFSSTYDNYAIIFDGISSARNDLQYQLRDGSGNVATALYQRQLLNIASGSISGTRLTNQTFSNVGYIGSNQCFIEGHISTPFPSGKATASLFKSALNVGTSIEIGMEAGGYDLNKSFTGIRFFMGAGTMTGSFRIYGLRNS
jgi:hypothetical protein